MYKRQCCKGKGRAPLLCELRLYITDGRQWFWCMIGGQCWRLAGGGLELVHCPRGQDTMEQWPASAASAEAGLCAGTMGWPIWRLLPHRPPLPTTNTRGNLLKLHKERRYVISKKIVTTILWSFTSTGIFLRKAKGSKKKIQAKKVDIIIFLNVSQKKIRI